MLQKYYIQLQDYYSLPRTVCIFGVERTDNARYAHKTIGQFNRTNVMTRCEMSLASELKYLENGHTQQCVFHWLPVINLVSSKRTKCYHRKTDKKALIPVHFFCAVLFLKWRNGYLAKWQILFCQIIWQKKICHFAEYLFMVGSRYRDWSFCGNLSLQCSQATLLIIRLIHCIDYCFYVGVQQY